MYHLGRLVFDQPYEYLASERSSQAYEPTPRIDNTNSTTKWPYTGLGDSLMDTSTFRRVVAVARMARKYGPPKSKLQQARISSHVNDTSLVCGFSYLNR